MNKKIIRWIPRILGILYIIFISLFALDVFSDFSILALFMHLIPTFVLTGILILAWYKEQIGGYVYLAMAIGFTIAFDTYEHIVSFLIITVPLLVTGALFIWSHSLNLKAK